MSRWTHAVCETCFEHRHPGRAGHRLVEADLESCCYCDTATMSGLYDRNDPSETPCKGVNGTAHPISVPAGGSGGN